MGAECRCRADTPVDDGLDTDDESGAPALVTMGLTPDIASPLEEVGTADTAPVVKRGPIATVLNEPMWVLGLVILVDEIDKNIVRGMNTPLKEEFRTEEHTSELQSLMRISY